MKRVGVIGVLVALAALAGAGSLVVSETASVRVSSFGVRVTGTLGATAFLDADAQSLIRHSLDQRVPPGYVLTGDPVLTNYQLQTATPEGEVTVSGNAVSDAVQTVSTQSLRERLRGLSIEEARRQIQSLVPGSQVDIRMSPWRLPWLPLNGDHITVVLVMHP